MDSSLKTFDGSKGRNFSIQCQRCGKENIFEQPYPYHAGFADQGFVYSDSGHYTLVWSWFDPVLKNFFSEKSTYSGDSAARKAFEEALRSSPDGTRWRSTNRAKCLYCPQEISGSMLEQNHYVVYPNSLILDENGKLTLASQLL